MKHQKISPTAARAVLAEIQALADDRAGLLSRSSLINEGDFAMIVLHSLIGSLEARLPRAEWRRVDVYKALRAARAS